jgi:hypothetical protein
MGGKRNEEETVMCPVGSFFLDMKRACGKKSKFFDHMAKSRVEFLKGIRSLIDESIEDLEKKAHTGKAERKRTKIKVE